MFKLTDHQQHILNESIKVLALGRRLLIKGSAGVGKTFMVNELVKKLFEMGMVGNKPIYCSAPTNKAVSVIQEKVDKNPKISFITTHAALKMRRKIDNITGKISFAPYFNERYPPLKGIGALIIDEASMLNSELLNYIEEYADRFNVKVVFIGDEKQLNPIGEDISPIFTGDYPEVELIEIIRQGKGNPIITLSRNLSNIKNKKDSRNEELGYMHSKDYNRVITTLAEVNGTSDLKYLAWTNKEVDKINSVVRKAIYGDNPNKIEKGETLIFNDPYGTDYFTNQEILVDKFEIIHKTFIYPDIPEEKFKEGKIMSSVSLKCYVILHPTKESVVVIHEDAEETLKKIQKKIRSNIFSNFITWQDFYQFKEKFANMKYNHALTVHKSQGSTYTQAIVNVGNINRNKKKSERDKMLYTAITRAAKLLILYNS